MQGWLFLFLIGLEMRPSHLWSLRRQIFGLGRAQILGCSVVLTGICRIAGLTWPLAFIAAAGFVLTYTAVVMPLLGERGRLSTRQGRQIVSILLLVDLLIIPLLALAAWMAPASGRAEAAGGRGNSQGLACPGAGTVGGGRGARLGSCSCLPACLPACRLVAGGWWLVAAGVGMPVRETFEAALRMGAQALQALGDDAGEAAQVIERVRELDAQRLALEVALADPLAGNELLFGNAGQPQPVPSPVRSAVPGGRIHSPTRCRSGLTAWAESGTIGVRSAPAADES